MTSKTKKISVFSNAKLQTKILIAFSSVILLAVISFAVFSQSLIFERFETEATQSTQQLCIKISENIDAYIENIDEITKRLLSDPSLLAVLNEVNTRTTPIEPHENLSYSRRLGEVVSNAIALTSFPYLNVNIYNIDGSYRFFYKQNSSNFYSVIENEEILDRLAQRKLVLYAGTTARDNKRGNISFVRSIFDFRAQHYGYIEIQDDTSKLSEICNVNVSGEVTITDVSGQIMYTTGEIDQTVVANLIKEMGQDNNGFFQHDGGEIFFYARSAATGTNVFIKYSHDSIYSSLIFMKNTTIMLIIFVSLVCLSLVFFFTKRLVKPIQDLRNSVLSVNYENMGLAIRSFDNNEIVMLGNAFQHILQELRTSMNREIVANKAEATARLTALQAQIAPHFIHNVLYSISICAREERPDDVTFMCKLLSDMLRYTVNPSKQPVKLKEEVAFVSNYLTLESKNYEGSLFYEVDIAPETEDIPMPRISIQPFVENSIKHAFKMCKPPYWVRVVCEANDGRWKLTVTDNGTGIGIEKIEMLEQKIKECVLPGVDSNDEALPNTGMAGMGIVNSILRMKMLYGELFRHSIAVCPEGGTIVVLEGVIKTCLEEEGSNVPGYGG